MAFSSFVASARARTLTALVLGLSIGLSMPAGIAAAPATPDARLPIAAAPVGPGTAAALDAALVRARHGIGVTGLRVAVVTNDGLTWSNASGVDEAGRPLSPADPFIIGSVTKTFTAAIVMSLVDEGRIELDAPVNRYLPKVRMVRGVTVRQLLTHTSGIADLYGARKWHLHNRPHDALSSNAVLNAIGPRLFAPGSGYAYSNTNYFLLGHVIEFVTGRSFAEVLRERIGAPLGLEHTRVVSGTDPLLPAAWSSAFWTSGAIASTPLELATFGQELFRGRLVSYESTRRMVNFNYGNRYGHGTQLFRIAGRDLPGHSGLLYSTTTLMVHLPAERITVVLTAPQPGANLEAALAGHFRGWASLLEAIQLLAA